MRFQIRYPTGATHEVELQGTVAILGRDPSCDLVLNDIKCSRRHAVVEAGPDGLAIRDTASANGVFVNGRRVERANLRAGDVVALGDVRLTVLPEDVPRTMSMSAEDVGPSAEATTFMPQARGLAAPPPPPPAPAPEPFVAPEPFGPPETIVPGAPVSLRRPRPLTVTVLGLLWMVSVPLYAAAGAALALASGGVKAAAAGTGGVLLALLSGLMSFGLLAMKPWARRAQIALAVVGLPLCPFSCASIAVLVYALQPSVRSRFADPTSAEPPKEGLFTAALLGTVFVGAILTLLLGAFRALLTGTAGVPPLP